MKKVFLHLALVLFFPLSLSAQHNQYGNHFITNYPREQYDAEPQNWSVVQDSRGVIYVGNLGSVLEYDGASWNRIPNDNGSYVRSMSVDGQGRIYVGNVGDFGYLKPDQQGGLHYVSLTPEMNTTFQDVWNVYTHGDTVYFSTFKYIFRYRGDSLLDTIPAGSSYHFLDFLVNGTLYMGDYKNGLMKLKDGRVVQVAGGHFYREKDIFALLPYDQDQLLVGTREGLYIYQTSSGRSCSIEKLGKGFGHLNEYIRSVQLYGGMRLSDGNFAFYSLDDGLVVADSQTGTIRYHYSDDNGLQDPTVITAFENQQGNIWLGLNNGISQIEYHSPIRHFGREAGLKGIPTDVISYSSKRFVATTMGIFLQQAGEEGQPLFRKLPDINTQVRDLMVFDTPGEDNKRLLAGTYQGIYDITDPQNVYQLDGGKNRDFYKTNRLIQSAYFPNRLYAVWTGGLVLIEYLGNGQWKEIGRDRDIEPNLTYIQEENDTTLWAGSDMSGILKIHVPADVSASKEEKYLKHVKTHVYDTAHGLPSMDFNKVIRAGDRIYYLTRDGFYRYDGKDDFFVRDTLFDGRYLGKHVRFFSLNSNQTYWVIFSEPGSTNEELEQFVVENESLIISNMAFKRMGMTNFQGIYTQAGHTWLPTANGLYSYNHRYQRDYGRSYPALIRQVAIDSDSALFKGTFYEDTLHYQVGMTQPGPLHYNLPYKYNDLSFAFSAPYFEREEALRYSYRLDGYDDQWSGWSEKNTKEYTNLDEGHYTFLVKARNIYGKESRTARFEFFVEPPWYRSYWAYLGYILLALGLIMLIVNWYTRRLKKEKERLEQLVQKRTREVVAQKEEIEAQRDEIARKNMDITDSIEYASKIQNAVLPQDDQKDQIMPEHFILYRPRDIVSGDFYWISRKNGQLFVIAADCTGHGVPGAFMSMLGISLLNEIVNRHEVTRANQVLNELRKEVKRTLKQTGKEGEAKDGMDMALAMVDQKNMQMQYAGAYNPLYLFRDGELIQYKADRMPIGIYIKEEPTFTNHLIELRKGDTFYIFSDGYTDQFGGSEVTKFKTQRLKRLLTSIQQETMDGQKKILERTLEEWRGDHEQLDDILLIGVRL